MSVGAGHEQQAVVRYWAAARAAAGCAEEPMAAGPLDDVVTELAARHGERLGRILGYCSFLLDGRAVHDRTVVVEAGSVLEVLPPFAGG
ncbi:MAG: sulfur-carrier protein [Frankiaceae bacterium]|jgi:molybdopterin converting factor small subunit|nr:sulfur-carrier protein [Frankiaceae bacterium]MDQ1635669.1 sulfur-carrier protein [Frankiaceae bacterium]MDQ1650761.1 sulfur-carrier protein [Frankiaceae bacterium]MDQ1673025.1 sulfur-carrier protein [Frankiaceae bacterium]